MERERDMRNVKKLAIPVVIVLILLIAGISIVSYFGSEVDLAEYIEIKGVTGLNGQGELQYGLDTMALYRDLIEDDAEITEENYEAVMTQYYEQYEELDYAIECITVTADKESGLSNGDTITVTAVFEKAKDRKLKYHFKDAIITYKVSDLTEGKAVDPFADGIVSIGFTGFSGEGTAEWDVLSYEEPYSLFSYELTPAHNLSNGDTVTITATADAARLEERGYFLPKTMEITYTVSGLTEYYDFSNGFSTGELRVLCGKALAACQAEEADEAQDGYIILTPSKVHKAYSMQVNDPDIVQKDYARFLEMKNAVCVITSYCYEATGPFSYTREVWFVHVFPNYYVGADGTVGHEESEDFDIFMLAESVEEVKEWLCNEYRDMTFTEISLPQ